MYIFAYVCMYACMHNIQFLIAGESSNLSFIVAMAAIENFITAGCPDLAPPSIVRTTEKEKENSKFETQEKMTETYLKISHKKTLILIKEERKKIRSK